MHIMISKMRKNHVSVPYQMNGTELERVTNTKYLGATISENLSWKIHNERAAHGTIHFLQRKSLDVPRMPLRESLRDYRTPWARICQ